jgi:hypothetical protein
MTISISKATGPDYVQPSILLSNSNVEVSDRKRARDEGAMKVEGLASVRCLSLINQDLLLLVIGMHHRQHPINVIVGSTCCVLSKSFENLNLA